MPAEMGDEVLEAELHMGALLDEVNVRTAVAYETGVWRKLCQGGGQGAMGGGPSWRAILSFCCTSFPCVVPCSWSKFETFQCPCRTDSWHAV